MLTSKYQAISYPLEKWANINSVVSLITINLFREKEKRIGLMLAKEKLLSIVSFRTILPLVKSL